MLTRWQTLLRAGVSMANDHTDPDYDAKIIDELGGLHERAEPVLTVFCLAACTGSGPTATGSGRRTSAR